MNLELIFSYSYLLPVLYKHHKET